MTIEQAIDIFNDNYTVIYTHGHYTDEEEEQARVKAIKSLEMCDKIVKEINILIQGDRGVELVQAGEKRALAIVEKYKKEIEE